MLIKALAAAAGNFGGGYSIDNSLRFNDDDSAYLSRTPSVAGNRKTWTWSGWVKRGNLGTNQDIFTGGTSTASASSLFYFGFWNGDQIRFSSGTAQLGITSQVFRDVSGWYHIAVAVDSTEAVANDRIKLYVNGNLISMTVSSFNLNDDTGVNATTQHSLGQVLSTQYFDGYMAEVNFIDGQALTPDDFGEISATTGEWSPIEYEGTYGTNGFYLPFDGTGLPQGFSGGGGLISVGLGSGGGGAGGAGGSYDDAVPSSNGGLGVSSSITGSSVARAGGGGAPSGGLGQAGGGNGGIVSSSSPTVGTDATANSGSGGGGGGILATSPFTRYAGGDGGSGIVILRYPVSGNGSATGGSETTISVSGVDYKVHTFTSSSTLSVSSGISDIEYVVIGGGGGGGAYGGGGGAGGYRSSVVGESSGGGQSAEPKISIVSGSYPVTVGAGGAGAPTASSPNSSAGQNGGISRFYTIECFGGGGGASGESQDSGKDGGSGGGGSPNADPATIGGSPLLPNDSSGNSNNWTENNLASTDYMIDATNNFSVFNPLSGFGGGTFSENYGADSSFAGNKTRQGNTDANGIGDFYYAPPAGYLALCTDNLPEPAIVQPETQFNVVTYSGDGTTPQSITGVGFQPDLVWIKRRDSTADHTILDVLRGDARLESNNTDAEVGGNANVFGSFDSDGFTTGLSAQTGASGGTYVAWCWKAGGTAVSNTDGSITSSKCLLMLMLGLVLLVIRVRVLTQALVTD
jgi:hypothetical protein